MFEGSFFGDIFSLDSQADRMGFQGGGVCGREIQELE